MQSLFWSSILNICFKTRLNVFTFLVSFLRLPLKQDLKGEIQNTYCLDRRKIGQLFLFAKLWRIVHYFSFFCRTACWCRLVQPKSFFGKTLCYCWYSSKWQKMETISFRSDLRIAAFNSFERAERKREVGSFSC